MIGDSNGHRIDVHSYEFDEEGNLLFGIAYPIDSLVGTGSIAGRPVRCISAQWMVKFHAAYEGGEKDRQDVLALCEKFGLPIPGYYANWSTAHDS